MQICALKWIPDCLKIEAENFGWPFIICIFCDFLRKLHSQCCGMSATTWIILSYSRKEVVTGTWCCKILWLGLGRMVTIMTRDEDRCRKYQERFGKECCCSEVGSWQQNNVYAYTFYGLLGLGNNRRRRPSVSALYYTRWFKKCVSYCQWLYTISLKERGRKRLFPGPVHW